MPRKLVKKIQAGDFVDMSELLPDRLGVHASLSSTGEKGDKGEKPQQKRRQVANIMEWVQCFAIYTAVVTAAAPDRTHDLLGYMALEVEARMEYDRQGHLVGLRPPVPADGGGLPRDHVGQDRPHFVESGIHRTGKRPTM